MIACLKIADQRNLDPAQIAHQLKSWTKDHWQTIKWDYDQKRRLQWQDNRED